MKHTFLLGGFVALALVVSGCGTTVPAPSTTNSSDTDVVSTPVDTSPVETTTDVSTPAPVETQTTVSAEISTVDALTMDVVAQHNSADSCYLVVDSMVYDATSFIPSHPGGAEKILPLCGTDASSAFSNKHGGQQKAEDMLATLEIGALVQ